MEFSIFIPQFSTARIFNFIQTKDGVGVNKKVWCVSRKFVHNNQFITSDAPYKRPSAQTLKAYRSPCKLSESYACQKDKNLQFHGLNSSQNQQHDFPQIPDFLKIHNF